MVVGDLMLLVFGYCRVGVFGVLGGLRGVWGVLRWM